MDLKAVQEILRFVNKSDLTEVELEEGDFKLKIKRRDAGASGMSSGNDYALSVTPPVFSAPTTAQRLPQLTGSPDSGASGENVPRAEQDNSTSVPSGGNLHTVTSPMIGTFYKSPSPDKDAYVKVGDMVRAGQTVCIIEAMKLFNEIESDVEGRIVKILVENAQPVEYDQPLYLIELTK